MGRGEVNELHFINKWRDQSSAKEHLVTHLNRCRCTLPRHRRNSRVNSSAWQRNISAAGTMATRHPPASYFHSCYTWKGDDTRNNQPPLVLRPPAPAPLDSAWKSLSIDDQETSGEQFVQRIPSESKSIPLRTATTSSLDLKLSRYSFKLSLAKYAHSSLKSHKIRKLTL